MTSLGNLSPLLKRRIIQTPSDQATQFESTTRPSAFSVHKAPPSRSLHNPASRDAHIGDVHVSGSFGFYDSQSYATVWCTINKSHWTATGTNNAWVCCEPQGAPADVWHPLHLRLQEEAGYLAVPQSQSKRPKR